LANTEENIKTNLTNQESTVIKSDLFEKIPQKFDYIFANLPIKDGIFKIKEKTENIALRFLDECKNHINPDGKVFFVR